MTFRLTILLLLSCFQLKAATNYLRAGASGVGGTNWTHAYTNWTQLETALARGDVGYVADGGYTNASPVIFNTPASGTSLITVKKATVADHGTAVGWLDTYGDGQAISYTELEAAVPYLTFDGVSRTSQTNGHGFKFHVDGAGLYYYNVLTNITMKYIEIEGHGPDGAPGTFPANCGIYGSSHSRGFLFDGLYIHDLGNQPFFLDNLAYSTVTNCWSARNESTASQHSEGVYGLANTNNVFANNVWVDIEGTGVIMLAGVGNSVFGNLIYWTADGDISNGSISGWDGLALYNSSNYQNTIVVPATGGSLYGHHWNGGSSGNVAYNNLYYCSTSRSVVGFTGVTHDYSWFYNVGSQTESNDQTGTGSPFVNAAAFNFQLLTDTDAGVALGPQFEIDMSGVTRSTWSRGALQWTNVVVPPVTPNYLRIGHLTVIRLVTP